LHKGEVRIRKRSVIALLLIAAMVTAYVPGKASAASEATLTGGVETVTATNFGETDQR